MNAAVTAHPEVDEDRVARDAAEYARRLTELTATVEQHKTVAQEKFDTVGLPRGLAPLEIL